MSSINLEEKWLLVENDRSATSGLLRIRIYPESCCELFLAVEKPQNKRALLLEVQAESIQPGTEFPQSKGFEVLMETLIPGARGKIRIVLKVKEDRFKDIFSVLVDDITLNISLKSNQTQGVAELLSRLYKWQSFLKNHQPEGLGELQQAGLYGELWFLRNVIINNIDLNGISKLWVGPCGANQDYQFSGSAVEVKTTTGGPHEKIRISNVRQLDSTGIDVLFLFHISLDVRLGGVQSLPELIEDIRSILSLRDQNDVTNFNDRLVDAGYLDIHGSIYNARRYAMRHSNFYTVKDSFPRILEQDLIPGVGDVSYSIELSACLPFQITFETALEKIKGEIIGEV